MFTSTPDLRFNVFDTSTKKMKATTKRKEEARAGFYYIRPYMRPGVANMGLERHDLILHEGTYQVEHLTCIEAIAGSGVLRYVTGLDEEAPEIRRMEKEAREVARLQIRNNVALIEKSLTGNVLDVEDKEFWNKVIHLKPGNSKFWNTVKVTVDNFAKGLDSSDPMDLLIICAIKAGGFSLIHKNKQEAESVSKPGKYYLDEAMETATFDAAPVFLRNEAVSILQSLKDKHPAKMANIAVAVRVSRGQTAFYNKNSPQETIYLDLDRFIHGDTDFEKVGYKASKEFIEFSKMENAALKSYVVTMDALARKSIIQKEDKQFYLLTDDTAMGRSREEVLAFTENPANGTIAKKLLDLYTERWNR
jgi:hypothetical protein